MICPLRRAHLAIWVFLALLIAIGFSAGLGARKKPATMQIPEVLLNSK